MFGHRCDGTLIKDLDAEASLIPYLMKTRNDATNYNILEIRCEPLDEFIAKKKEEGKNYSYMDILLASAIRVYATRPRLNRFTIGNRVYQRNGLYASFTAKRGMTDESPDATMKIRFTGRETIEEVHNILAESIKNSTTGVNNTDKTAKVFRAIPPFLVNFGVGFIKWLDKLGLAPKKIIEVSPFHTSFYFTNLKSLHGDFIFHHLYNFGTTGMFYSIGKEKLQPVVEDDKIKVGKVMTLGMTTEERYCDGFYFIKSVRMWKKMLENPYQLEEVLDIDPIESPKERKKRLKQLEKATKKQQKVLTKA